MERRKLLFDRLIVNYKNIKDVRIKLATLYLDQLSTNSRDRLTLRNVALFGGLSTKMLYISVNNLRSCQLPRQVGRPPKMDENCKAELREYIETMEELSNPASISDVRRQALTINSNHKPELKLQQCSVSETWVRDYIKESSLHLAIPVYYDPKSSVISIDELNNYINILDILFSKFNYINNFIFNIDESWLNPDCTVRAIKVVTSSDCRRIFKKRLHINKHLTFLPAISATGKNHRGYYIWPYKKYNKDAVNEHFNNNPLIYFQKKGWMTSDNFYLFISELFVPTVFELRKTYGEQRALLILDSHSSRFSFQSMKLCSDNGIDVVTLPAHSTQYLQPLDVLVFCLYKNYISNHSKSTDRYSLLETSELAISEVATPSKIKSSFERAGLQPYSSERIRNSIPPQLLQPTVKKKFTLSGNLLTSPEILEKLCAIEHNRANIWSVVS